MGCCGCKPESEPEERKHLLTQSSDENRITQTQASPQHNTAASTTDPSAGASKKVHVKNVGSSFSKSWWKRWRRSTMKEDEFSDDEEPLQGYRFSQPDTEGENIVWMDETKTTIKFATLTKLVEKLTDIAEPPPQLVRAFLLTYQSFCSPDELLELLIQRFKLPTPPHLKEAEDIVAFQRYKEAIQLRVWYVLKLWIEEHWTDFDGSAALQLRLDHFVKRMMLRGTPGVMKPAHNLNLILQKKSSGSAPLQYDLHQARPPPIVPSVDTITSVLEVHPREFARQLTMVEDELYTKIRPSKECMNQAWTKPNKHQLAPNVITFIEHSNRTVRWVITQIVSVMEDKKKRTKTLSWFIRLAYECKAINNFNACVEIVSGLNSAPVARLKQTWEGLSVKRREMFKEFDELMLRNYKVLRGWQQTAEPPCLPFVGVFLTDLVFIEDGNKDKMANTNLINFHKRMMISTVIQQMNMFQKKHYDFLPVRQVREFICRYTVPGHNADASAPSVLFDEAQADEMSRKCEPPANLSTSQGTPTKSPQP